MGFNHEDSGFSLLEVIASLFILSIALVIFYPFFIQSFNVQSKSSQQLIAHWHNEYLLKMCQENPYHILNLKDIEVSSIPYMSNQQELNLEPLFNQPITCHGSCGFLTNNHLYLWEIEFYKNEEDAHSNIEVKTTMTSVIQLTDREVQQFINSKEKNLSFPIHSKEKKDLTIKHLKGVVTLD